MSINENVLKGLWFPETHYFSPTNIAKGQLKNNMYANSGYEAFMHFVVVPYRP